MTLSAWFLAHEVEIRLISFLSIFTLMAIWEIKSPQSVLNLAKGKRWFHNILLVILNSIVVRLIVPFAAVASAIYAQQHGWGLFNVYNITFALSILLAIIILDFIIYLQHIIFHNVPFLWRLHRVHHADLDFDLTTGARFHTIEIILSSIIKLAFIILIGAPVIAVIIFEVLLNAMAMFNHANIKLPKKIDTVLRWFIVTPDMHRIHHSIETDESNSNFGFNLSCWDRIFNTYRPLARAKDKIIIGLKGFTNSKQTNQLLGMMLLPFKGKLIENTKRGTARKNEP